MATPAFTNRTSIFSSFTASSGVFWLRPEMATLAPSLCSRCAVARPIPLFPPVTTATFPSNRFIDTSRTVGSPAYPLWFGQIRYLDDYLNIWLQETVGRDSRSMSLQAAGIGA